MSEENSILRGKTDRYWSEEIDRDGIVKAIDLAESRLGFFKANAKLADDVEGWGHLDSTAALLKEISAAIQADPMIAMPKRGHYSDDLMRGHENFA